MVMMTVEAGTYPSTPTTRQVIHISAFLSVTESILQLAGKKLLLIEVAAEEKSALVPVQRTQASKRFPGWIRLHRHRVAGDAGGGCRSEQP